MEDKNPLSENPLKTDAELTALLKRLDAVKKYKTFQRWKTKFLDRLEQFLYEAGMKPAEIKANEFDALLKKFVKSASKVQDFIEKGDLGENKKTVRAALSLSEMCKSLTTVVHEVETVIPSQAKEEKKLGFTKFHLGAVLIRQGFHQYVDMKAIEDALTEIGAKLETVADKQQHDLFQEYKKKVQQFCDVMADLNLYEVMLKCIEFAEAPEEEESSDEEPVTLQITIDTHDGKKLTLVLDQKETIGNIKDSIVEGSGIPADRQVLKFGGKVLDDSDATLESLGIPDKANLTVEPFRVPITVNIMGGKQVKIMVDPTDYITDLKRQLQDESGVEARNQALFMKGDELHDPNKKLDEFGIQSGSVIDLEPKIINVTVKRRDGKKISVAVKPSDNAGDVKAKIETETGLKVDQQVLKSNGEEFPDNKTIKDMGMIEGDELEVDIFKVPVTVNTLDGKTIKILVDPTDRLSEIKRQLEDDSGIPAKNQKLSMGGTELADPNKTASEYGIKAGSVLDLEPKIIKVNVKTPDGKIISIEVTSSDSGEKIKEKIAEKTGMTVPQQVLRFNGKEMPDGKTVKDMGISDGSDLEVDVFKVPVTVNSLDGKTIKILVDPTDRLSEIKRQLEDESGIPAKNQKLSMGGTELADPNKTASEYGIKSGSVLDLEPKIIKVNVKTPDGKTISVQVSSTDAVESIKEKIAKETGMTVPQQVLRFNGKEMPDEKTVKDMGISDGSDLEVDVFKVPITVNTMDGKSIKVMVDPTDKLSDIKHQLEDLSGIPAKNQKLFMKGEELSDPNKSAGDYGIKAGSVLDLEPKSIKVNVETPDGKKYEIEIKPSETDDDIKKTIAEVSGMAAPRQVLKVSGKELPHGKTVKDMGILDGSIIQVGILKMPIKVKTSDGKTVLVDVEPTDSIEAIKKLIEKETGIAHKKQILHLNGEELKNNRTTAKDAGIKAGSELVLKEQDDPIIFVDCKAGTLFAVDRDDVVKKNALTPHQNNKLDFIEAAKDTAAKEKILKAMQASPNLGVASQVVVTGMDVEDYELEEAEKVQGVFGVKLKKREKNKKGEEFIFVDPRTGASGELSRKKYIDSNFITLSGHTIEERETDNLKYDKYIAMIRSTFGVKEFA